MSGPPLPKTHTVMDRETTIQGLFSHLDITFCIPPYQRAYAWETLKDRKQVGQFLDDLKEHPQAEEGPRKSYFLGHFLFEREQAEAAEFFVIDGQQRLTTLVIFFHCLIQELASRQMGGEQLRTADGGEVDLGYLRRTYVMGDDGSRKMKTVDYDDDLFRSLLQGTSSTLPKTRSGERLVEATELMAKRMREEADTAALIRWMELAEKAVVTTFEVKSKEQATQIFAFQNDRGKDLTNLEKLKAFLMHMVYVHSPVRIERESINDVELKFADIYRLAEEIETLKEDQVLAHHLIAFVTWTNNPVELLKKELRTKGTGPQRVEWIRTSFCSKLVQSFRNVREIEHFMNGSKLHERLIGDVLHLNASVSWPLLLKLMHFHAHELPLVANVLRLMEITLFKLQFMKGKSINRLPNIANDYQGALETLEAHLKHVSQRGFHPDWDFNGEFQRFLEGSYHYDKRTRYLLWKYENDLRDNERGVHHLSLQEYLNETEGQNLDGSIEHIMPKDPETLVHPEAFVRDWLHNLGNLVLMTLGRNSSLKNKLPIEKANSLEYTTPYLSQQAVVKTIRERGWGEVELAERKKLIVDFALRHWRVNGETHTQAVQP
jgi:hypothetical protein